MTRWFFALMLCAIGFGWLHAEDSKPKSTPSTETDLAVPDLTPVPDRPATIRVRVPVERTDIVDMVVEGVGKRTAVTKMTVAEQDIPLPTSPEEIQKFRDELKALRSRQIDTLEVESLLKQVYEGREAVREQQAWTKLERIRQELTELENTFWGTKAATVGQTLREGIPASLDAAPMGRTHAPTPIHPFGDRAMPRDSVDNIPPLKAKPQPVLMPIKGI